VAVLAKFHNVPFHVVAPTSSFDLGIKDGTQIPIEERSPEEIICGFGKATAPPHVNVYNPAFDVTPAELISSIITEAGIIQPVTSENIRKTLGERWKPGL
jgi:methylthioribose-1-phosphate isomerase